MAAFRPFSRAVWISSKEMTAVGKELAIIRLAAMGQMMAFEHRGFWQAMDTLRDKSMLEELWASGKAPWKSWH